MVLRESLNAYAPQPASLGQDKVGAKRGVVLWDYSVPEFVAPCECARLLSMPRNQSMPPTAANHPGADALQRLLLRLTFQKHLQLTGRLR